MSHDYTNYSKPQEPTVTPDPAPVVDSEVKVNPEPTATPDPAPVVDSEVKVNPEPTATPDPTPVVDPEPENDEIIGVVVGCKKLNVRKEPSADADVLTTIPEGAEVKVDIFESTEDFYKVCTEAGVEGYCVIDYIKVED